MSERSGMRKVLILCTGNSCRSIMAEALINRELGDRWRAYSAGVAPAGRVSRHAGLVLEEIGLDTSALRSKSVDEFVCRDDLDLVVTVCDFAKETCPAFAKPVKMIHVPIEDPYGWTGSPEEVALSKYREARDTIRSVLIPMLEKM